MLLAGVRLDDLDLRDVIDVAYAALIEPSANGSWVSIEEAMNGLDDAVAKVGVDEETFGMTSAAERGQAAAERVFGGDARSRPRPARRRRAVPTGNPLADALARTIAADVRHRLGSNRDQP